MIFLKFPHQGGSYCALKLSGASRLSVRFHSCHFVLVQVNAESATGRVCSVSVWDTLEYSYGVLTFIDIATHVRDSMHQWQKEHLWR